MSDTCRKYILLELDQLPLPLAGVFVIIRVTFSFSIKTRAIIIFVLIFGWTLSTYLMTTLSES